MNRSSLTHILFDLDGTLVDPLKGITGSYRAALNELGVQTPSEEVLRSFIGPPLRQCMGGLLKTSDPKVIEHGVARYRHYYVHEKYMFRDSLYPEVEAVLQRLKNEGRHLFVATSKAQSYAREILVYFGLERYFVRIYGSELDGTRSDKKELLTFLLEQESLPKAECLMIGDRMHDVIGAKANGVGCIGVTYGYGSREELKGAGALSLCGKPRDLPIAIADTPGFELVSR